MTARAALGWLVVLVVLIAAYAAAITAIGWLALAGLIVVSTLGTGVVLYALGYYRPDDFGR